MSVSLIPSFSIDFSRIYVRFEDLEMDTVIGRNHKGALLTINDRVTKLCWIFLLKSRDSHILSRTTIEGLSYLKDKLKTITVDNGKEFAQHKTITEALGIPIFGSSVSLPLLLMGSAVPTKR